MEPIVLTKTAPKLKFNNEDLKKELKQELEKYQNNIITEETKKGGKKSRAELNTLKKKLNKFRIESKKQLFEEPTKEFEKSVAELIDIIDNTLKPIDEQLKALEDARKAQKTVEIEAEIAKIIAEFQLDKKHASELTILEKYLNSSEGINVIIADLKNRAEISKKNQKLDEMNRQTIIKTCKAYEDEMTLDAESYLSLLAFQDIHTVIENIHKTVVKEKLKQQEKTLKEPQKIYIPENPKVDAIVEKLTLEGKLDLSGKHTNWATFKVTGRKQSLIDLGDYMEMKNITFEVIEKGEI